MRILQIIQKQQLRGAEIFASQLAQQLKMRGHDCKMIALYGGEAELPFDGEIINLKANAGKRFFDPGSWKKLSEIIKAFQPDIVQANASDTLKFAVFSKKYASWKAPLIFRNANKMGDFIDSRLKKIFNQWLVNHCKGVVSVSHLCQEDFEQTFGYPKEQITTVQIGVNFQKEVAALPADLTHLSQSAPLLVNVSSLVPEKNHEGLLHIFSEFRKAVPEAQLAIVGDGKLRDVLKAQVKEMGLERQVHLLGFRSEALSVIKAADIFVLPSKIEGLPGVILEAFMMETPVVANNVGGIGEVVLHEETGMLISPDDPTAFVNACKELWQEKNSRNKLTSNALTLVQEKYTNQKIAERFEAFYQKIAQVES